jgi:hypothetical protein
VNPALWLLLGLQTRGWLRYLGRSVRTVKGAVLALVGLSFSLLWLVSVTQAGAGGGPVDPEELRGFGPAGLLLYCLMSVLLSSGERAIYFSPAEVHFLFPGPFGRRQLLAYKILSNLLVNVPSALLMALLFRRHAPWFLAGVVGLVLIFTFMQLFGMALNLVATTVGESLYGRARGLALAGAALLAVGGVVLAGGSSANWRALWDQARQAQAWQEVSTPLRWFFDAFLARSWPDLAGYALRGLLVNGALLVVVFALDARYLEAAAAASARIYSRRQRLRGRNVEGGEPARGRRVRLTVPDLPWWGGVGPILWRQLTTALRGLGRLAVVFLVLCAVLAGPLVSLSGERGQASLVPALVLVGAVAWFTVFLTALVPFDFRGDVDRLAVLKTLPLPAWRLTVGQLLAPVLVLSALQWLVLAAVLAALPAAWPYLLAGAAYAVPFNFLVFGLENLLFLLFPTRLQAATPGDFQALGRNLIFILAKMLVLSVVAGVAVLLGAVAGLLTGGNLLATLGVPWPFVAVCGAALVPAVAFAFTVFDVGRDTPP